MLKREVKEIVIHVPLGTHNQEVQNVIYVPMDIILIEQIRVEER